MTAPGKLDSTYPLVLAPSKLTITQAVGKMRTNVSFTIRNVSDKDIVPVLAAEDMRFVSVKLPKVVKAGKTADAIVQLANRGLEEGFETSITLEATGLETPTRFTIPIRRVIRTPGQDITKADQPVGGH